jgi:serine/threonine-protein kinase RsbW
MSNKTFPANFDQLDSIREFVGDAAKKAGMNAKEIYAVQLAVDEAASNVIEHAYEGLPAGNVDLNCTIQTDELIISVSDHGAKFNPLLAPAPNIDATLEERSVGGLGVFLIRKIMDDVRYDETASGNVLTMVKKIGKEQKKN